MKEKNEIRSRENTNIAQKSDTKTASLGLPQNLRIKRAAIVIVTSVILAVILFWGGDNSIWSRFAAFAADKGFMHFEENSSYKSSDTPSETDPPSDETGEETESLEKDETVSEETSENDTQTDSEMTEKTTDEDTEGNRTIMKDYSESDKGFCYAIDKYGAEIDLSAIGNIYFTSSEKYYSAKPVVLIMHTHTSEAYYDADLSKPGDNIMKGVVAIGERVTELLNSKGIPTVHCTVMHDMPSNLNSYEKARETLKTMLEIYPTIKYVIDIHRMSDIDNEGRYYKSMSEIGSAQVSMLVDSENDEYAEALKLALNIRKHLNSDGSRICMPVIYSDSLHLADTAEYYMKLCVGTAGNDFSEADLAAKYFAEAFSRTVKK